VCALDVAFYVLQQSQARTAQELTVEASVMGDDALSHTCDLTSLTSLTIKRCHLWLGGGLPVNGSVAGPEATITSDAVNGAADEVMQDGDDTDVDGEGVMEDMLEDLPFPIDTPDAIGHTATPPVAPPSHFPVIHAHMGVEPTLAQAGKQGQAASSRRPPPVRHLHVNSCDAIHGATLLGGTCASLSSTLTSLELVALRVTDRWEEGDGGG
jgi:hypothetical protein